jgi:hypothetical protein
MPAPGVASLLPPQVPPGDRRSRIASGLMPAPGVASLLPPQVPPGDRRSRIASGLSHV